MNSRQLMLAMLAKEIASGYIGGLENTMMDYPEDSQEYQDAKHDLALGHDRWVQIIVTDVKVMREVQKHLKFAGNKFLEDYVSKLLTKWGY